MTVFADEVPVQEPLPGRFPVRGWDDRSRKGKRMSEFWHDAGCSFHPVSAPDYLPRKQLQQLQLHRLKAVVHRSYDHVPLFRQRMEERNLKPSDLQDLKDIAKLPFMVKTDLRDTYPFGLFAS